MRAGKGVKLQPFQARTLELGMKTDSSIGEEVMSSEEREVLARSISTHYNPSSDNTQSTNGARSVNGSKKRPQGKGANATKSDNVAHDEVEEIQLGLITSPVEFVPSQSRLPEGVAVRSGVIPCINAPVQLEVVNLTDNIQQLPNKVVLAEVYLLNPLEYSYTCEDSLKKEQFVNARVTQLKNNPTYSDFDAVVDNIPKLPPIPPEEPLPPDLQDLVDRCDGLTDVQKKRLAHLLRGNHDIFAKDNLSFGKCPWMQFTIDTGDHPPIKQRARPIPIHYRQAVKEQFLKYLECGAVVPSNSAWASPILCVLKKTGEVRVCIDYRQLNAITRIPATPIPRTQDLLEKLAGHEWYTHTDVAWGYHNVELHPDDRCKTAVILPDDLGLPSRQFEFTRLSLVYQLPLVNSRQ